MVRWPNQKRSAGVESEGTWTNSNHNVQLRHGMKYYDNPTIPLGITNTWSATLGLVYTTRRRRRPRQKIEYIVVNLQDMVPAPLTASALSTACHAHWVLCPFLEGAVDSIFAVDGTGAVVSFKRALTRLGRFCYQWLYLCLSVCMFHQLLLHFTVSWCKTRKWTSDKRLHVYIRLIH